MSPTSGNGLPGWAEWRTDRHSSPYTVGIEEELMLLDTERFELAFRSEEVIERLPPAVRKRASLETHASVLEIATDISETVGTAVAELGARRRAVLDQIAELGLTLAGSGTHPTASWEQTEVSDLDRYRTVVRSMRVLARREPTMAMHVHVAVPSAESAICAYNALRHRLPLLLALSANSPYWQGRDTGLASTRTPLFHAFPRTGIPAPFRNYADWVERVGLLIRAGAIPDASFLWWDVRLQPAIGTVEVRIMDAQVDLADVAALTALIQALVRLGVEAAEPPAADQPELLLENRFLAARDGARAQFIAADGGRLVPLREQLDAVLEGCAACARSLDCAAELAGTLDLARTNGAIRQRAVGELDGVEAVARWLASRLTDAGVRGSGRQPPRARHRAGL